MNLKESFKMRVLVGEGMLLIRILLCEKIAMYFRTVSEAGQLCSASFFTSKNMVGELCKASIQGKDIHALCSNRQFAFDLRTNRTCCVWKKSTNKYGPAFV